MGGILYTLYPPASCLVISVLKAGTVLLSFQWQCLAYDGYSLFAVVNKKVVRLVDVEGSQGRISGFESS